MTISKWAGGASFLLAVSFVVAPLIYLTGNLRDTLGVFTYNLADFLYGPVVSASLVTVVYVLRERIGERALRRMDLALLAAVLSAAGMAAVAFIRASNRHYHLIHPELGLENSTAVLIVWTTLVAGVCAAWLSLLDITYFSPPIKCIIFSSGSLVLVCLSVFRTRRVCFIAWHNNRCLAGYFALETQHIRIHKNGLTQRPLSLGVNR
jgi:hypothetical protein